MGWTNFIIIKDWKMIIETNRNVQELDDYIKKALEKIINKENVDIDKITDLKVEDITIKDLCDLASTYDNTSDLFGLEIDKLFLYWLESRDIEYEIKSEHNINLEEYKNNLGYNILRLWPGNENDEI